MSSIQAVHQQIRGGGYFAGTTGEGGKIFDD